MKVENKIKDLEGENKSSTKVTWPWIAIIIFGVVALLVAGGVMCLCMKNKHEEEETPEEDD